MTDTKKEASRKKSLGELGELYALKALVDNGFNNIKNLNDQKRNEPFADLLAEKDGIRYTISVKARNKNQGGSNFGKTNDRYNLGKNVTTKAKESEEKYKAKAHWMGIEFDNQFITIYFGSMEEIEGHTGIPINKCRDGKVGRILLPSTKHYLDWDYFSNRNN
jgi:hypothetical protein